MYGLKLKKRGLNVKRYEEEQIQREPNNQGDKENEQGRKVDEVFR